MSTECLFCSIIRGDMGANLLTSNDLAVAFSDINPQAPTHVLVVPRAHHDTIAGLVQDGPSLDAVMSLAAQIGQEASAGGFRLVVNTGPDAGQTVLHVHAHVLAGRALQWPPG